MQEAQVTIECVIDQKVHRTIMGPKGSNVQAVTQEHNVSIKFPDRDLPHKASVENGDATEETNPRNVILITGRQENAEAAKQALMVRGTGVASYLGLLTPVFVAHSTNVEGGLVKLSHVQ